MQGLLIVRIFLAGLILVVPDQTTTPQSLHVMLVEEADHHPQLAFLGTPIPSWTFGITDTFEGLSIDWLYKEVADVTSSGSLARGSHCGPNSGPSQSGAEMCDSLVGTPHSMHPGTKAQSTDFDWVARLSDILGHPADVKTGCLMTPPKDCQITARLDTAEGTLSTCRFVTVPSDCLLKDGKTDEKVPAIAFDPGSGFSPRALSLSMVLELSRPLSEVTGVKIRGSYGAGGEHDQEFTVADLQPCKGTGNSNDRCLTLALTNLPDPVDDSCVNRLRAEHFANYYKLLAQSAPSHPPLPTPLKGFPGSVKKPDDVTAACPFAVASPGSPVATELEHIVSGTDRPICPLAAP